MELIAIVNLFLMWQKAKCSQYITFPFLLTHSSVPLSREGKQERRFEEHVVPLIDKRLYKSVKGNPPGFPSCGKIPQCSLALIVLSADVCVQNVWVGDELDLNL